MLINSSVILQGMGPNLGPEGCVLVQFNSLHICQVISQALGRPSLEIIFGTPLILGWHQLDHLNQLR